MKKQLIFAIALSLLPVVASRLLERCYDTHGCATCAGYTWCPELEECLRFWENPCNIYDYMNETDVEIMSDLVNGNNNI